MATRTSTRPLTLNLDSMSNMMNGKRKSMATNKVIEEEEPDKKKRKPATKKQPAFKPQPVPITNSSDTPPDDNDEDLRLLPPPSERKIARRRESTRELRERQESPTPGVQNESNSSSSRSTSNNSKRIKTSSNGSGKDNNNTTTIRSRSKSVDPIRAAINTSDDPLEGVEETESMRATTTTIATTSLSSKSVSNRKSMISTITKSSEMELSKPSHPRPKSPPRRTFSSGPSASTSTSSNSKMEPPKQFIRKTRQSMGRTRVQELSKESVIPLMESETPVIRKNQQIRGQQARRSSLDHRGSRASSSWGRGEITMPHKNVDSKLFYRHIPSSYPEPIKARMLLVWCADRALQESLHVSSSSKRDKGKGKAKQDEGRTEEGDKMLNEIMDEFVREMNRGGVDTSVFGVPGQEPTVTGLKPHPRNVSNRKVEAATNADIKKFKGEKSQWTELVSRTRLKQEEVINQLEKKKAIGYSDPDMSQAEGWMKDALSVAEGILAQGDSELESKGEFDDVEFKVDTLHQTSHVALQYVLQSSRFLDGIFSSLTADLRTRDRLGFGSTSSSATILPENTNDDEGPDTISLLSKTMRSSSTSIPINDSNSDFSQNIKSDPISLLRLLASKEINNDENDEILQKAMQIPPVTLTSTTATSSNSNVNLTSATPRKQLLGNSIMTPGRNTGLNSQTPRSRRGLTPVGPSGSGSGSNE
ncbi:uncharacterized protein L201_005493 [Kwoniella dendrophila CBS 6074]|uniref:Kinetochore protein Mis13/DSN1 n=1 Tax=Kwoniella dendrophila CBS 6074 TaxID=1295534 RepID=A0AAX4JYX7_9TREE